jgi:hypothetical protein
LGFRSGSANIFYSCCKKHLDQLGNRWQNEAEVTVCECQTNRGGLIPPVLFNTVAAPEYSPTLPAQPGAHASRQSQTAMFKAVAELVRQHEQAAGVTTGERFAREARVPLPSAMDRCTWRELLTDGLLIDTRRTTSHGVSQSSSRRSGIR